jgi:hypothetical protein
MLCFNRQERRYGVTTIFTSQFEFTATIIVQTGQTFATDCLRIALVRAMVGIVHRTSHHSTREERRHGEKRKN